MNLVTKSTAIFDRIIGFLALLAAFVLVFMMLIVGTEVVSRYFLGSPIRWVVEITEYLLLFMTFLATAWVLRKEGHVKVDLVLNLLKPGAQPIVNIITSIICALMWLLLTCYGVKVVVDHIQIGYHMSTRLAPPAPLIIFIIPIGSFLLSIQFLRRAYGFLESWRLHQAKKEGRPETHELGV